MKVTKLALYSGRPAEFDSDQLGIFEQLVAGRGRVIKEGLGDRIRSAHCLVLLSMNGLYRATMAIKKPTADYVRQVFDRANVAGVSQSYRFELGWLYVDPAWRNRGIYEMLRTEALLSVAKADNVYSVCSADSSRLAPLLARHGFSHFGWNWDTPRGLRCLFVGTGNGTDAKTAGC